MQELIGAEPGITDIVLDMRYIDPDPGLETRHILRVIESLPLLAEWRSLILAGTVIPLYLNATE